MVISDSLGVLIEDYLQLGLVLPDVGIVDVAGVVCDTWVMM